MSKLIECPMCEKMISPNAHACPQCGEPMKEVIPTLEMNTEWNNLESNQELFDVLLSDAGQRKIGVIKVVRELTNLGLKEAKNLVDYTPSVIATGVTREVAQHFVNVLVAPGAYAQVVPSLKTEDTINKTTEQVIAPNANQPKCPRCYSSSLSANKKGFGLGKAIGGAVLLGPVGILGGAIGSNKIKITCLNCGHTFKPNK